MNQVYLLLGPEQGEKEIFVKKIIKNIKNKLKSEPEVSTYYPFDTQMIDIVSQLQNGSLFSSYKVVIVNNVHEVKQQREIDILVNYCKEPSPDTTLFLISSSIKDVSKKLEKVVPKDSKKIFWELFESRKAEWIRRFFHQKKMSIEPDAVKLLIDMIEGNTKDFKQECSKLAMFFGENVVLTSDNIEKYVYHSKEENVFTLFEYMAERNFSSCLEVLYKILLSKESEPVRILSGLLWQIRRLHLLKRLLNNNYSMDEAFKKVALRNKKGKDTYSIASKNYSLKEIEGLVMLVADYDNKIRSYKTEMHMQLLQLFLYHAVVCGGRTKY